ncbi:MAG: SGNH/GDSL hydrolase family protein [Burkholderiaceae bacterium]
MNTFITLIAFLSALLTSGAGLAAPTAPPCPINEAIRHPEHQALGQIADRLTNRDRRQRDIRIVALGSSSTQGYGAASPEQSYPSQLSIELTKRLPGVSLTVFNEGVGGETISTMARRINSDVLTHDPDLIIWQVGSNALLQGVDPKQVQAGLIEGIETIKRHKVALVLMGMQYAPRIIENHSHQQIRNLIIQTSQDYQIPLFDRYGLMQFWESELSDRQLDDWIHQDGLHMTGPSYQCLANALAEYLLALRPRH